MWVYEKKLQFPVDIKKKDLRMAKNIISQLGGANGELAASLRYLNQRYSMPDNKGRALLTDIGTEELAHNEIIATMLYQLTKGATPEEMKAAGLDTYYAEHGLEKVPADAFSLWNMIRDGLDPAPESEKYMLKRKVKRKRYM